MIHKWVVINGVDEFTSEWKPFIWWYFIAATNLKISSSDPIESIVVHPIVGLNKLKRLSNQTSQIDFFSAFY